MNTTWKLQDAKSHLSRVVEEAIKSGPQYITRRGEKAAVILSIRDYDTLTSKKTSFKEFLLDCPKIDEPFVTERSKDYPGSIEF